MMHDFELHEFFHSPKNVLLKALLYWNFLKTLIFKVLYLLRMCPIFVGSVQNSGKSDNPII